VIMVFLFLIAKQLVTVTNAVSSMVAEAGKLQIAQSNIIDSLDRLLNSPGVIQLVGAT